MYVERILNSDSVAGFARSCVGGLKRISAPLTYVHDHKAGDYCIFWRHGDSEGVLRFRTRADHDYAWRKLGA